MNHRGGGRSYRNLITKPKYTVQVGDFGFDYRPLETVDAARHKILAGNHDNYVDMGDYPHFLGDYGNHVIPLAEKEFTFFYIRGAFSVDKQLRTPYIDWWPEEELTYIQMRQAFEAYVAAKPKIMVSHDCPDEIIQFVARNGLKFDPSATGKLLQACYEEYQPDVWIFGHHHRNWMTHYDGRGVTGTGKQVDNGQRKPTLFICLNELGYLDLDDQGNLITPRPQ
jgi:hypothetical protein